VSTLSFICQRCAKCCKNLVFRDSGVLRGLTLFPDEIKYFSDEYVEPYLGVGKRPHDKGFRVIAYQLITTNCPHLEGNQCKIYEKRPISCRQFPFSLDPDLDAGVLLGVDMNCPAAVELVNSSDGRVILPDRESAEALLELKKVGIKNPRKVWIYDLDSKRWVRYDKLF